MGTLLEKKFVFNISRSSDHNLYFVSTLDTAQNNVARLTDLRMAVDVQPYGSDHVLFISSSGL